MATQEDADPIPTAPTTSSTYATESAFLSYSHPQPSDTRPFYALESQVLDLWHTLNDLHLSISIHESLSTTPSVSSFTDDEIASELRKAELAALTARAEYVLSTSAVTDTIITAPVLRAVHHGPDATFLERELGALVRRRDGLGVAETNLERSLVECRNRGVEMAVEGRRLRRRNGGLGVRVRELSSRVKEERTRGVEEGEMRGEIEEEREREGEARRRWRVMKSVVRGVVVGSGVDWAGDEKLTGLVLDEEDEGVEDNGW